MVEEDSERTAGQRSRSVCSPRLGERETDRGTAVDCGGERQREGKEEDMR